MHEVHFYAADLQKLPHDFVRVTEPVCVKGNDRAQQWITQDHPPLPAITQFDGNFGHALELHFGTFPAVLTLSTLDPEGFGLEVGNCSATFITLILCGHSAPYDLTTNAGPQVFPLWTKMFWLHPVPFLQGQLRLILDIIKIQPPAGQV